MSLKQRFVSVKSIGLGKSHKVIGSEVFYQNQTLIVLMVWK